jgi:hypothetical protein
MAETAGARTGGPRGALLDEVRAADVFVLVLGARYGQRGASGRSPTEDEYTEALAGEKPILVFVHDTDMEDEQRAFLNRVRGSWDKGELYERFSTPEELALGVATALGKWRAGDAAESIDDARDGALRLARGDVRRGGMSSGVAARVALVPTVRDRLLGPLELEDPTLAGTVMAAARQTGLAAQTVGLKDRISSLGIAIESTTTDDWITIVIGVGSDGSIVAQASVRSTSSRLGSFVDPTRFTAFVTAAGEFAKLVWDAIDPSGLIKRAAVTASIPDSTYKGWGNVTGNSIRMSTASFDATAPVPPEIYQRSALGQERYARELAAAMGRAFADAGATTSAE